MIAQIEERERTERIRQGYLDQGGSIIAPQISGRIEEPSFTPAPKGTDQTPTIQPRPEPKLNSKPVPIPQSHESKLSATEGSAQTYSVPTPQRSDLALARETVDPSASQSREELRRLSEEDTRRRMVESGVDPEPGKADQQSGEKRLAEQAVGSGGLVPRRRGAR
ncbi:MAG: hypothetical protein TREMPRED_004358 [Tremellales sp. Tagirdzhanova-0007]|nr:MAG: hypothetical protein TREMPRED_004358 [Tremellales sp. Tagirdzhanova-0007]